MNVQIQLINSLDSIDFAALFLASYTRIDKNFLWPATISTYEQKEQYYYNQLQSAVNGTWPLKEATDTFIMIVTKVDDVVAEFAAGYLGIDGYVALRWNLTADLGPDGSRNWRYTPEADTARRQFTQQIGAIGYREFTWVGSLLYKTIKARLQSGRFELDEIPFDSSKVYDPNRQPVELRTRFI
jgi:hypothetical protein